jgi:hypothetical protein
MPVNTTHPEYDAKLPKWQRARAVLAGEDAVKDARESFLPRIQCHTDAEYDAYRKRATFFNATARTAAAFVGMIFRRPPFVRFPEHTTVARFETDADLLGSALPQYAREILTEVIQVGRCGTLVDWEESSDRPHCVLYRAEDILNWRVERVSGKMRATLIVLRERVRDPSAAAGAYASETTEHFRVLRLDQGAYHWTVYREHEGSFQAVAAGTPLRNAAPLPAIPFVFHGAQSSRATVGALPLDDLIAVNLDHYRLDAEYKHGLHFTALPTAWAVGFQSEGDLKIGSSTAWLSDNPEAHAGFLEFHGHGLTSFERALERDERLLAVLGSRLLEPQKRQPETAEALAIRTSGEESVLEAIAGAASKSLTEVLRWVYWWSVNNSGASPEELAGELVLLRLNEDFGTSGISSRELEAVVASWQAGAISRDTMLEVLRKGELLPDGRTNEEELRLIAGARTGQAEEQA